MSIPRLYAAASLKLPLRSLVLDDSTGIPRLYAAASLKPELARGLDEPSAKYSAALCRGLIEASIAAQRCWTIWGVYSAALCRGLIEASGNLQGEHICAESLEYSAALCRGLIEDFPMRAFPAAYSAALCRASLKLPEFLWRVVEDIGIPRLYAAASLKPVTDCKRAVNSLNIFGIPRLYAAASLKRRRSEAPCVDDHWGVFRGSMPRPH